ncbi:MAG: hypothetical protein [Podoviridae sp. ctKoA10]|nr:MAG: hypothetical protein [Podoviridae sp. ctKoA10]
MSGSKIAISAVISDSAKRRIKNAGAGNFTKGVEVCSKYFAPFARGTDNFKAADEKLKSELLGKSISDCVSFWLENGYWLPNLLCYLSQELSDGNLTIDSDLKINQPEDYK